MSDFAAFTAIGGFVAVFGVLSALAVRWFVRSVVRASNIIVDVPMYDRPPTDNENYNEDIDYDSR